MEYISADTIFALSTAPGIAAVSVIRLSGADAHAALKAVFHKAQPGEYRDHQLYYGHVFDERGHMIDEAMAVLFYAPRSYTKEPMAELHCHGSGAAIRQVFEALKRAGARAALPGEFTYRAFENGRLDLSQSQAVMDIIRAQGDAQQRSALSQLNGAAHRETARMLEQVQALRAQIEVTLDYPEEDLEKSTTQKACQALNALISELVEAQCRARQGILLQQGVQVVLCGKPNVGKSALMNALLKSDRSIVTPWAGTTRDVVQDTMQIEGVTVHLSDTAGIHETADHLDALGVARSREALERADLAMLVLDASRPLDAQDTAIAALIWEQPALIVLNKMDLPGMATVRQAAELLPDVPCIAASALQGDGIQPLCHAILEAVQLGQVQAQTALYTHTWQLQALQTAESCCFQALNALQEGLDMDCAATDLRDAAEALGAITGDHVDEDLVTRIFNNFCIGK